MERLKILITGANGLLGKEAVRWFSEKYDVHAIVREIPPDVVKGVKYYVYDFTLDWTTDTLPSGIHSIFHLAQSELFRDFPERALDVYHVNVTSTVKLLDYARSTGVKKFIFTSTGGLYDFNMEPVHENSPISTFGTLGNYFATKLCSEILTQNYTSYFDVSLLRIFFMYGKGQKRSMLIPRLVDSVREGRPITLTASDGIKINPVHVSDVINVIDRLIHSSESLTFNVAGPEILSLKQIAEIIGEKVGVKPIYAFKDTIGKNCIADTQLLKGSIYQPSALFVDKIEEVL